MLMRSGARTQKAWIPRRRAKSRAEPHRTPPRTGLTGPAFVGLTGGIGAGKTTALEALERLGAEVLSTDEVVHGLYEDTAVRDAVVKRFGPAIAPGGRVDRAALASRAFATAGDRAWLEQLMWPRVDEAVAAWRDCVAQREPPPRAAVVEVPLLFESGMDQLFDATLAIVADEELRAARAATREHRSLDERLARQLPQSEKAARATYVVVNDGSLAKLEEELSDVLLQLDGGSGT